MTAILGIDIAKQTFDATLIDGQGEKRRRHFDNTGRGHEQLHQWVQRYSQGEVHVCMESTSRLAIWLAWSIQPVSKGMP